MQAEIKNALESIRNGGISIDRCLGELVASILFTDRAVFIDSNNDVYFLIPPELINKSGIVTDLIIVDFISVLKELESSQLIFVLQEKGIMLPALFYSGCNNCRKTQFEGHYDIGNGKKLICKDDSVQIEDNERIVLCGVLLPKKLGQIVARFLSSVVYPTQGFNCFIKRGFITEEQKQAKRANTISAVSVLIAILIAISAPFLTVWWSNSHGQSTINDSQFEQMLTKIESIDSQLRDTISVQCDSPVIKEVSKQNSDFKGEKK